MHQSPDRELVGGPGSHPVLMLGFMLLLAALDFAGTMLAKEWTLHREPWQLIAGAGAFVGLFVVLVSGLRYAEMSILTLGWIVVLQTAVIVVDQSRYGTTLSVKAWLAMLMILVLQGYLVVGGSNAAPAPAEDRQSSAASAAS